MCEYALWDCLKLCVCVCEVGRLGEECVCVCVCVKKRMVLSASAATLDGVARHSRTSGPEGAEDALKLLEDAACLRSVNDRGA